MDKERIDKDVANMDADALKKWQLDIQKRVVSDWWSFSDDLIMKWNDMSHTHGTVTSGVYGYPPEWSKMVGFSNAIHPIWVKPAATPEPLDAATDYVPACTSLPKQYDQASNKWI